MRLPTAILCLTLALSGCAGTAQRGAPALEVDLPATWSNAPPSRPSDTAALLQWWLNFHDSTLNDLIAQSLAANTQLLGAQAALRQARALSDVAAAALFPTLDASVSAQRGKSGDTPRSNRFNAALDASWEADVFGANRSGLRASRAAAGASAASLADLRVSIAAEVALDYIALRSAQARLAIANINLTSQHDTLQITQWKLQAGLVTSLESEQARAAYAQTLAQLPALRTSIEQTRHALALLAGRPPMALANVLAEAAPLPRPAAELALSLPAETLRQRPDLRAAEYQVTAAQARVSQARAARFPNLRLGGSIGLSALTLGTLTSGAAVASALLAGVAMPVFDGGAARAQQRAQEAALEQAILTYRATVLTALSDVENALIAMQGDALRLAQLQQAAEAAGNAALLARQRYNSGLVDFQVVLETQRSELSTQDGAASADADLSADHVRLYKALGGGWQRDDLTAAPSAAQSPNRMTPP